MVRCGRPCKGEEQLSNDRLLDAAAQLFNEHGYGNLSMETLAREARVSLRTLYNLYGNKAGLFGALIRRCSDQWIDSLPGPEPFEESLNSFARQFLFRITRPDVIRMRAILIGESPRFPDLANQFYDNGPKRTLAYLAGFFRYHQQSGLIKPLDAEILAEQYISALRGERFQRLQLGLDPTPEQQEIDEWVAVITRLFIEGCIEKTTK